jgi:ectoine hydroxylase-related dioxygenase (phytanoyl-CoA dioxygenase family)
MLRIISPNEKEDILNNLDVYGFSIVKNLVKREKVKFLLSEINKIYKEQRFLTKQLKGLPKRDSKDLRVYNLPQHGKIFIDLISNKELEKILIPLINDKYYRFLPNKLPNYIVNSLTARSSGYALDLHIDSWIPYQGNYPISVLALFVLEDMYEENGATMFIPGSHQSGKYTNRSLKDKKIIEAKSGDLIFMDSRTWHGTTENKTQSSRWLINVLYSQWWLKQQVDIVKSLPKSIYQKLNNKQKQLMGFCSIPPKSELERVNTKCGYSFLKSYKI